MKPRICTEVGLGERNQVSPVTKGVVKEVAVAMGWGKRDGGMSATGPVAFSRGGR